MGAYLATIKARESRACTGTSDDAAPIQHIDRCLALHLVLGMKCSCCD